MRHLSLLAASPASIMALAWPSTPAVYSGLPTTR